MPINLKPNYADRKLGDFVTYNPYEGKSFNKHLTVGKEYKIIWLEYPAAHFRGRWKIRCDDGKVRAFYPNRFIIVE